MVNALEEGKAESLPLLISYIKENALRGSDMIRDFVDNEFLESAQIEMKKYRLNLVELFTQLIDNYQNRAEFVAKIFRLITDVRPVFIYLDGNKFQQVMNNLISNAIKFTEDNGEITITLVLTGI